MFLINNCYLYKMVYGEVCLKLGLAVRRRKEGVHRRKGILAADDGDFAEVLPLGNRFCHGLHGLYLNGDLGGLID
jgi:hypothetical protein